MKIDKRSIIYKTGQPPSRSLFPGRLLGYVLLLLMGAAPTLAATPAGVAELSMGLPAPSAEDSGEETLLMFVGETDPMVTVASRAPESPLTAPAMVRVIDREQIERRGYRTLAELLADQPGFYLTPGGRGSVPYLRGLRDSVLFLYDGVPLTSDVTKSFPTLDREISLAAVERVEILNGAGSVLWGVDAFSGVVNIVPRQGSGSSPVQVDLAAGNREQRAVAAGVQQQQRDWNVFLFGSDAREIFHGLVPTTVSGDDPQSLSTSRYQEIVGTLNYHNRLSLTGRWSDFDKQYSMRNAAEDIFWAGSRQSPMEFIKAGLGHDWGASHYSLTGFYQNTTYQVRDADVERSQQNRVTQVEFLWDRRLWSRGILTAGATWRDNVVNDAVVQDGFLPDFLAPEQSFFVPQIEQEDFSNQRLSWFGQYRHQWTSSACWAGLRLDDHSQYGSTINYSLGLQRTLTARLNLKAVYGTAFRSPYSSQLFGNEQFDPEAVSTASLQLAWQPRSGSQVELTLYHSELREHRVEDPYGGLSLPSDREMYGAELSASVPLTRGLEASAGLSLREGERQDEAYQVLAYSYVRPDGTRVDEYDSWTQPFDQGPSWLARVGLDWQPWHGQSLVLNARVGGDFQAGYEQGTLLQQYQAPLLLDLTYRYSGFLRPRDSLTLRVTNLLDHDYLQPDLYGPVQAPPATVTLIWTVRF